MGILDEAQRAVERARAAEAELAAQHKVSARFHSVDVGVNGRGVPVFLQDDERAVDPRDRVSFGRALKEQSYFNDHYDELLAAWNLDCRSIREAEDAVSNAHRFAESIVAEAQDQAKEVAAAKAEAAAKAARAAEETAELHRQSGYRRAG